MNDTDKTVLTRPSSARIVIGNFVSCKLPIVLLLNYPDYLLIPDERHAPTQEQGSRSARRVS